MFKKEFKHKKYLDVLKYDSTRNVMSQWDYVLIIWKKNLVGFIISKCRPSNMNAVESEYHFLLCCPKYTNLRELYFSTTYKSWANAHKFVSLLSSENNVAIIKLGKYLKEAFELRYQSLIPNNAR